MRNSRWMIVGIAVGTLAPMAGAALDPVEEAVQQAVQSSVEEQVAEQVADQVAESAASQVEESVTGSVTDDVADQVADSVTSEVAEAVQSQVQQSVDETLVGQVLDDTTRSVVEQVEQAVSADLRLEGALEPVGDVLEVTGDTARQLAGGAGDGVPRAFVADVDPAGRPIERGVLMLLLPEDRLPEVRALGFTVRRTQPLSGLGRVLVRLEVDPGVGLGMAARRVRAALPGAVVDYNHLYDSGASDTPGARVAEPPRAGVSGGGWVVGVIDTAVDGAHPALQGVAINARDFVAGAGIRPTGHGTAIASVLVGSSHSLAVPVPALYAASVFFEREPGLVTATSEALVQAMSWMIENAVGVINMSLTGPPNELLHAAVTEAASRGALVVAAVGNNGPAGAPLFPAAYDGVIGVTAVDARNHIFVYANRGRQVSFSAPGVGVRVAKSGGGYADEDGTSLAAAHATLVIAAARAASEREGSSPAEVVERLKARARDLGDQGFDETYGHGLIAPLGG